VEDGFEFCELENWGADCIYTVRRSEHVSCLVPAVWFRMFCLLDQATHRKIGFYPSRDTLDRVRKACSLSEGNSSSFFEANRSSEDITRLPLPFP
jgi:hypothetical protein